MRGIEIQRTIKVNITPEQWELYTDSFDAATMQTVAEQLNKSFEDAVNYGGSRSEVWQTVTATMNKLGQYGAADSEPYYVLENAMQTIFGENR